MQMPTNTFKNNLFVDEQLWKASNNDLRQSETNLMNKAGVWIPVAVTLPEQNKTGFIMISNEVFSIRNDSGTPDDVIKEVKNQNDDRQKWLRGVDNAEGYFTLSSLSFDLYLTATGEDTLQVQGNIFDYF